MPYKITATTKESSKEKLEALLLVCLFAANGNRRALFFSGYFSLSGRLLLVFIPVSFLGNHLKVTSSAFYYYYLFGFGVCKLELMLCVFLYCPSPYVLKLSLSKPHHFG